jgi:hypothetical protein
MSEEPWTHAADSDASAFAENLAYLLWQEGCERRHFDVELSRRFRWARPRAIQLLYGAQPEAAEVEDVAREWKLAANHLQTRSIIEFSRSKVSALNLAWLLDQLHHGQRHQLAQSLGVHASTLSSWQHSGRVPRRSTQKRLLAYFGLGELEGLTSRPLFLLPFPATVQEKRAWLMDRLEEMAVEQLQVLFPALRLLMERQ